MRAIIAVPATLLLIVRAYTRRSLTTVGIISAALTATIHALHPSAIPFTLLCTFFLLGTSATKVKHDVKATLTLSSSGQSGGEGPRTSVQVFANSGCASALILLHLWLYAWQSTAQDPPPCFGAPGHETADLLLLGMVCNYAAVTADTLSSELGILSKSKPVLITSLRTVPPGTNGGVTVAGLLAGMAGAAAIASTTGLLLPVCPGGHLPLGTLFVFFVTMGTLGTLLDSLLGAVLQASVIDRRSGKIIEGAGGTKVLTKSHHIQTSHPAVRRRESDVKQGRDESRLINSGHDVLDNNQINVLMASIISLGGMALGRFLLP